MTLKISTHNIPIGRLMREDMRHRSWMITLSCLASFIVSPVCFLFLLSNASNSDYVAARLQAIEEYGPEMFAQLVSGRLCNYFSTDYLLLQMVVLFAGALIVAICGFQYLYSRRMIDLYHSTPATRQRLFVSVWLNGFLIWFLPFLLGHLAVYILALYQIRLPAFWGGVTVLMLKELGLFVLCFLIVYNACLVPVMISGNAKNAFVNILIYGLAVLAVYGICISYMARYLDTFYSPDASFLTSPFSALSPLASPAVLGFYFAERAQGTEELSINGSRWAVLLFVSAALMLVNLAAAMALYKKRSSELAEHGVESPWFRIPLGMTASVLAGLLLSLFFSVITWEENLGWTLFGAVFGCTFAFACMNILHHASFKALFKHKRQFLLTLAFTLAFVLAFFYDAFGYDRYLPRKKDITGIMLYSAPFKGDGFGIAKNEDGYYRYLSDGLNTPGNIVFTDQENNYRLLQALVNRSGDASEDMGKDYRYLDVQIDTTHGSYRRHYRYCTTGSDLDVLKPFLEDSGFREFNYPAASGVLEAPAHINVDSLDNQVFSITEPQNIERLYQAYAQDFVEHFDADSVFQSSNCTVALEYNYPSSFNESYTRYHRLNMNVPAWYARTFALLEEWFPDAIWTVEDLDLTSVSITIDSSGDGTLDALQAYLGIADPATETSAETAAESSANTKYCWQRIITDPAELNALKPYLYIGRYSDRAFAAIGSAEAVCGNDPSRSLTIKSCYLKLGEIPPGFVESLRWEAKTSANKG